MVMDYYKDHLFFLLASFWVYYMLHFLLFPDLMHLIVYYQFHIYVVFQIVYN